MRRVPIQRSLARRACFERCEDRLYLSSTPWGDFCAASPTELPSGQPQWVDIAPQTVATTSAADYVRQTYGFQGDGQTVVVIDTGIAYDHPALGGGLGSAYRVVGGWDFSEENDANPYDDGPAGFHGTHVAGIIGADDPTHPGVAPGVDLVALRVFNDMGAGQLSWVEQALQWVHDHRSDFRFPITTVNLSLGVSWNADTPPSWATLEEELGQLQQDGIFVAAAAGNDFENLNQPGLIYPAASPYVVPAASVGADGLLSSFSQRNDRVLAVPGEQVVSTVPDYLFGADGNLDDWAAASGTSMASPYLAGVAVLMREALLFQDTAAITPSLIYDRLFSTADLVYDSATQASYHRVNLARALDSLMPADDYGSNLGTAEQLGLLQQTQTISGMLARLDDSDVFQFVAGATGQVVIDVSANRPIQVSGPQGTALQQATDGALTLSVQAGQSYSISVSARNAIGHYDIQLSLISASPVQIDGNEVQVKGTDGDDVVEFFAGAQFEVRVNGQSYALSTDRVWQFQLDGGLGDDRLILHGSAGTETVTLRPGSATMRGPGYTLAAEQFRSIEADSGGGLADVAYFYDSAGDDTFVARPNAATLSGSGYHNEASGFQQNYAFRSAGGTDVAHLHGSGNNDLLIARPDTSWLQGTTADGTKFYNRTSGFDQNYAYGSNGGNDVARFYDSAGDDLFIADPATARMQGVRADGSTFYNRTVHFDQNYAYGSGGNDVARFHGSNGDNLFIATPDTARLQGVGSDGAKFYNRTSEFDQNYAYGSDCGNDIARFYDSAGDEMFIADPDSARMQGTGAEGRHFYNRTLGFDQNYAYGSGGGNDIARFYASASDDTFIAKPNTAWLQGLHGSSDFENGGHSRRFYNRTVSFDQNYAYGSAAGNHVARFYDSAGDDTLIARPDTVWMQGTGYYNRTIGFQQTYGYATSGANDVARFYDSVGSDVFAGGPDLSAMRGASYQNRASNFDRVIAYATRGSGDVARLTAARVDDSLAAWTDHTLLRGAGYSNDAWYFDQVVTDLTTARVDAIFLDSLDALFMQLGGKGT